MMDEFRVESSPPGRIRLRRKSSRFKASATGLIISLLMLWSVFLFASPSLAQMDLRLNVSGVPNFIYIDEERDLVVDITLRSQGRAGFSKIRRSLRSEGGTPAKNRQGRAGFTPATDRRHEVDATSTSPNDQRYRVTCSLDNAEQIVTLKPLTAFPLSSAELEQKAYVAKVILPMCVRDLPADRLVFSIAVSSIDGQTLAEEQIVLVPINELDSGVFVKGRQFRDSDGRRAVVCSVLDPWQKQREWAVVKALRRWRSRRSSTPVYFGAPWEQEQGPDARPFWEMLSGLTFMEQSMTGPDSSCSLMWLPLKLRSILRDEELSAAKSFLISLPLRDIRWRMPAEDVLRSLDIVAGIIREERPGAAIAVMTPCPMVGESKLSEFYAETIRRAAKHSRMTLVDVHESLITKKHWQSLYSLQVEPVFRRSAEARKAKEEHRLQIVDMKSTLPPSLDGTLFYPYPLAEGQLLIAKQIAAALKCEVLREYDTQGSVRQREGSLPPFPGHSRRKSDITPLSDDEETILLNCKFPGEAMLWRPVPFGTLGDRLGRAGFSKIRRSLKSKGGTPAMDRPGGRAGFIPAIDHLSCGVYLPKDIPEGISVSACLKDKDGTWFQATTMDSLKGGRWNRLTFDLSGSSPLVTPRGHRAVWDEYYRQKVTVIGLSFFCGRSYSGTIQVRDIVAGQPSASGTPILIDFRTDKSVVGRYEKFEATFRLVGATGLNQFDPEEIEVKAHFTSPSGRAIPVDAFFSQSYDRALVRDVEEIMPVGQPQWKLRFAPAEIGTYKYTISVRSNGAVLQTSEHQFTCKASDKKGFVQVSKADPRFFEYSNGEFFYPIGQNIHAPFDVRAAQMLGTAVLPNRGTFAYEQYFKKMAASGQNACVIWMAPWWLEFEWDRKWKGHGGLTSYHMGNAWRLDKVMEEAEKRGIAVHLVLENHGKYSGYADPQWESNPYNLKNGGMLAKPEQFFVSEAAKDAYKKKLRYIISRWGYSTSLFGLELFGELNLVGSTRAFRDHPSHTSWVTGISKFLAGVDPYGHLISVHYSNDWRCVDPRVAALPGLDYVVGDIYKAGGCIVPWILETFRRNSEYKKPTFSTEFGGYWNGTTPARLQADLHAGLWSNFMTQSAGAPHFWWFDVIDRYDLYFHMKALSNFARNEDKRGDFITEELPVEHSQERKIRSVVLKRADKTKGTVQSGRAILAYAWIYDEFAMEVLPEEKYAPLIEKATICLGLPEGEYDIEFWDTYAGRVFERREVRMAATAALALPDFKRDIALKIRQATIF